MTATEIRRILSMADDEVMVPVLDEEQVEDKMAKRREIMGCANVGFTTSLSGACCCAQVDESCSDGLGSPDSVCLNPVPSCV